MLIEAAINIIAGQPMVGNVTRVWLPFAETVSAGGQPYLDHWDNKPPLWQYLNLTVYQTGQYRVLFTGLIAAAHATTGVLLVQLMDRDGRRWLGVLAAIFYGTALPFYSGDVINPRPFAIVALLAAFLVDGPVRRGVCVAVAGLLSQFSVLVIPAVVLNSHLRGRLSAGWLARFAASGLAVVVTSFAVLAGVWSFDAAVAGFKDSFFATSGYVQGYEDRGLTAWTAPVEWLHNEYGLAEHLSPVLVLAGIAVVWSGARRDVVIHATAGVGLLVPIVIRPSSLYWLPAIPFFASLAGLGVAAVKTMCSR